MVIPVRDEAAYIGPCLESVLASDPPPLEVVVVDDGSEDETWETVAGKPWACQRGAGETAGDFVLFIDADVRLEPWALGEASRRMATHGLEMLSWVGDIEYPDHLSQSVGPLVDWFLRGTIDLEAANDRGRPEGMARGAFLMVLHSVYDEVGGHAGVRDHMLEDVALARAFKQRARNCGFFHAPGAYRVVQRRGLLGVLSHGRRRLYEGLGRSPLLAAGVVLFVLVGMVAPFVLLATGLLVRVFLGWEIAAWTWLGWLSVVCSLVLWFRWRIERIDGRAGHQAWFQPLSALVFAALLLASTFEVETTWRGREYVDGRIRH